MMVTVFLPLGGGGGGAVSPCSGRPVPMMSAFGQALAAVRAISLLLSMARNLRPGGRRSGTVSHPAATVAAFLARRLVLERGAVGRQVTAPSACMARSGLNLFARAARFVEQSRPGGQLSEKQRADLFLWAFVCRVARLLAVITDPILFRATRCQVVEGAACQGGSTSESSVSE